MYRGLLEPEEVLDPKDNGALDLATLGGGVGTWHLYNGRSEQAREIFERRCRDRILIGLRLHRRRSRTG